MTVVHRRVGWGFWLWWVLASIVVAAGGLSSYLAIFFTEGIIALLMPLFGALFGALVGIIQWFILRRQMSPPLWWVLSNALAFALIGIASSLWVLGAGLITAILVDGWIGVFPGDFGVLGYLYLAGYGALFGFVVGIIQWLVLRRHVAQAGWWVLANIIAFAVGIEVLRIAGLLVRDIYPAIQFIAVYGGLAGPLAGAVAGIITGTVLVWLLRQPVPEQ